MSIVLRKLYTKCGLNMVQDKGVIDPSLSLPWQPSYHGNEVCD